MASAVNGADGSYGVHCAGGGGAAHASAAPCALSSCPTASRCFDLDSLACRVVAAAPRTAAHAPLPTAAARNASVRRCANTTRLSMSVRPSWRAYSPNTALKLAVRTAVTRAAWRAVGVLLQPPLCAPAIAAGEAGEVDACAAAQMQHNRPGNCSHRGTTLAPRNRMVSVAVVPNSPRVGPTRSTL